MYFIDENKNKFVDYFIKQHNQYNIPLIIIVGKENENNQLKSDISTSIKELDRNRIIEPNIFKFSNLSEIEFNNLFNLNFNLFEFSAFYNQLGDEYKYPKKLMDEKVFDKVTKEVIKNFLIIYFSFRQNRSRKKFIYKWNATYNNKQEYKGK